MACPRGLLPLLAAWMAACAWRGPRPIQSLVPLDRAGQHLAMDETSWKLVAVRSESVHRDQDGRLALEVELENISGLDLAVEIGVGFQTSDRNPAGERPWSPLLLPARGDRSFRAVSPDSTADRFELRVRTSGAGSRGR